MAKAFDSWTVLDHGPIEKLSDNLWRVEGALPNMALKRQMIVVRLEDGRLLIHNPIALQESAMQEIEQWGTPAFIVVPNGWHRLDSANFKRRYSKAQVLCPRGSRSKIEQVVTVDGTYESFPQSASVSLEYASGINDVEGVLKVCSPDGTTLVFNDLLFNVPHQPGVFGLIFRLLGSTGGPRVTRIMRLMAVKDRGALKGFLERLAGDPQLHRLVPGHGKLVDRDAADVLQQVASTL